MLPLIWIYVRIRTSPDGSRRHRQNLFDRPPLFFFSSLISFAENSANSLYEQSEGRLEFFFRRRWNIFLIKLSRVINFKKFTFTRISVYFFFKFEQNSRKNFLSPNTRYIARFPLWILNSFQKEEHNARLRRICIYLTHLSRRKKETTKQYNIRSKSLERKSHWTRSIVLEEKKREEKKRKGRIKEQVVSVNEGVVVEFSAKTRIKPRWRGQMVTLYRKRRGSNDDKRVGG